MRRGLAVFLLGVGLFLGTLAWTAFIVTHTVLDPGRSERVAESLLEDERVRDQIRENLTRSVDQSVPPEVALSGEAAASTADRVLDSPAVDAVIFDALVATHQAMLGEGEAPGSVSGPAFGDAARDSLVESQPALDALLPEAPSFEVPLPTERVPNLGPVRDALTAVTPFLAGAALAGIVLSLVVTTDRPAVLRRAGFWAIGLAATVLAIAFGVPALADRFLPDQAAVVSALVEALSATTRVPALGLAGVGLAGVLVSFAWRPAVAASAPASGQPRTTAAPADLPPPLPGTGHRRGERARRLRGGGTPPAGQPVVPASSSPRPARPQTGSPTAATPTSAAPSPPQRPAAEADPTGVVWDESARGAGPGTPPAAPARQRPGARWVDGTGWVHEGSGPIPDGARFVPGVGYVLD